MSNASIPKEGEVVRLTSPASLPLMVGGVLILLGIASLGIAPLGDFIQSRAVAAPFILVSAGLLTGVAGGIALRQRGKVAALARDLAGRMGSTAQATPGRNDVDALIALGEAVRAFKDETDTFEAEKLAVLASNKILALSVLRARQVLDSAGEGIVMSDERGNVTFANRAAAPYLSGTPESAVGQPLCDQLAFPEASQLLESEEDESATHAARSIEFSVGGAEDRRLVSVFRTVGADTEGEVAGQLLLFRDMSQQKSVQEVQTEFVDAVAHELRTPLTSIRAYVEMLVDGEAGDEQAKYDFYNIIYEETYRLSQLIDNLLNISMLESGAAKIDVTPTRVKRMLEEGLDVIRPQCEKKGIVIVADLPDRLPTLDIDKKLFGIAIMNILGNAAKYTKAGGTIELTTQSSENAFLIKVRDTGVGIPEEDLHKIFDKFYRAESAGSIEGSGVGLSTAQQIIALHGGRITASSTVGEGSEFAIELPRGIINAAIGD